MSELLQKARDAGKNAYCPYSNFHVGAAVETDLGVFVGCNVENASYGLCNCAERTAIFSAIAAGAKEFRRLSVSCLDAAENAASNSKMPCGACRQVIAEFFAQDSVIEVDGAGAFTVAQLLPMAFLLN